MRVSSVSAGTRRVRVRARSSRRPSRAPCSSTSRASSGSCRKPRRKPVAQITWRDSVQRRSRRGSARRVAARASGSSHARPGGYEGASSVRSRAARSLAPEPVEAGEAAPREVLARDVQRPADRLAPAHRDDLRAGGERVQPLGRRCEARRRRRSPSPRTRAARRHGRRAGRRAARPARSGPDGRARAARGGRRRRRRARSRRATARTRSMRAAWTLRSQPLRSRSSLDVGEELVDGRVVAVENRGDERRRRAPSQRRAHREARETWPAGSGRRSRSASRAAGSPRRAAATAPAGSSSRAEDRDLLRLEPAASQRLVRREAREAGADDGDTGHYFTEPASSPWTK